MSDEVPSRLVKELERIESGQLKVLTTCCINGCVSTVEVNLTPSAYDSLKAGRARFKCSLHRPDNGK